MKKSFEILLIASFYGYCFWWMTGQEELTFFLVHNKINGVKFYGGNVI